MKEFNLTEYLKNPSQKVITRDGRAVRIICTDAKGEEPIIALLYNKNRDEENVYTYNRDGRFYKNDSCLDLFFAPVKKEGWINIYFSMDKGKYAGEEIYRSKEEAIENKGEIYITSIKIEWEE